jgi:hypothetical protein
MLQRSPPSKQAIYNRKHRAWLKAGRGTAVMAYTRDETGPRRDRDAGRFDGA